MKRIVLCADDYGQEEAISKGILALAEKGRLSAISCMVTEDHWPEHAAWLMPLKGRMDIGLHFNLTTGKPLSTSFANATQDEFLPLPRLLAATFLRRLSHQAIAHELRTQIARFEHYFGQLPRFIDGHQHVHQFPQIRTAFFEVYQERLQQNRSYVRWVNIKPAYLRLEWKKSLIRLTGTKAFGRLLKTFDIPHNQTFSGSYSFPHAKFYAHKFPDFIKDVADFGLIMCHPGLDDKSDEVMRAARQSEFQFFMSDEFLELREQLQFILAKFPV